MTAIAEKFTEYLKSRVGDIYVWGAQGETDITEEWIRRRERSAANARRAIALWEKRVAMGRRPVAAFDCSGLIVRFLLDNGIIARDLSSRGLYAMSEKLGGSGELEPGDLVFRHDGRRIYHVGAYIGGGRVIEARGRDCGVVERDVTAGGWNRYGRLAALRDYPGETGLPAVYEYAGPRHADLNAGPGGKIIGRINRGERVLALAFEGERAEVVARKGSRFLRGLCSASGLVRPVERERRE